MKKATLSRLVCTALLLFLLLSLCSCAIRPNESNRVTMKVEGFGRFVIELAPEEAPISVENFKNLVSSGFYDGLTFHRIADLNGNGGYIIQGGDPDGNGTGGSGETIKGEFKNNGVDNNLLHTRGVISMARTAPDSGSSQFFICTDTLPHLDNNYAAFGRVISGMDVVDEIAAVQVDYNSAPVVPVIIDWAKMGTHHSPTPYIFLAVGITIVLAFVYVTLQTGFVTPKMEEALSNALGGNKRKRKALEKQASGFYSALYLHAKDLLPRPLLFAYLAYHAALVLFCGAVWALCLCLSLATIIISAATLLALVASIVMIATTPSIPNLETK